MPYRLQPSRCWMPAVVLHPTNFQRSQSGKAQAMDGGARLRAGRAFSCSFHLQSQRQIRLEKSYSTDPCALQAQQGTWHHAHQRSSQQLLQNLL